MPIVGFPFLLPPARVHNRQTTGQESVWSSVNNQDTTGVTGAITPPHRLTIQTLVLCSGLVQCSVLQLLCCYNKVPELELRQQVLN